MQAYTPIMIGKTVDPAAGAAGRDLLEQLQDRMPDAISREVSLARAFLDRLRQQPAEHQAHTVTRLDSGWLKPPHGADSTAVTVAVCAAALQLVKSQGGTPSERVAHAVALLDARYPAGA